MVFIVILAVLASGCSSGMKPGRTYPSVTFDAPAPYQEVHRRAVSNIRTCAPSMIISDDLYTDTRAGSVRTYYPASSQYDFVRISFAAVTDATTAVEISAMDEGVFDRRMIEAIKSSLISGTNVCR
ncbi:BPTD_2524 family lipoprotein [Schauerella aestuarii]|uniref:BPTD_2524 family lipoprotein n=1 Tax=Schauerella aestuarii TaxID=2511204 RepID=UPI0038B3D33D